MSVSRLRLSLTSRRFARVFSATLIHVILLAGMILVFLPVGWALSTSLKEPGDLFLFPPIWIPNPLHWQNYVEAMTTVPFGRYFLNTALLTGSGPRISRAQRRA
ncbi:MAG TPA: hypothetical protein VKX96_07080 [Chloroflexota bacterium]|nr:hypothetical protein [Chloroflexota bacterium]